MATANTGDPVRTMPGSARERAYDGIREGILRGAFRPGAFIEEAQACEATGVSRTPVREALTRLAAEGFVDLHPRRGAMVRPLLGQEMHELHEVRWMIESRAVRRICELRLPVPARLREICDEHEAASADDHLACVDINRRFHHALVEAAGNGVLTRVFENLHASLSRVAMLSLQLGIGRYETIDREHRDLVAALRAHDQAAALAILERHLRPMPRLVAALSA